jgi:hypothetical protein
MGTAKNFIIWLLLSIVCAGGTVLAVQILDKPLGLRQKVLSFGR